MTTQCSSTPEAISGILLAGDAVLNLSGQTLNCVSNTRFVAPIGESLSVTDSPARVVWRTDLAHALPDVASEAVDRVVVVSESQDTDSEQVLSALKTAGIAHIHCTLTSECDAAAFMDEEDAEAVAERLRQLGYL